MFGRYEGNDSKTSRVPPSQKTFDVQKEINKVISNQNLMKLLKDFDLVPTAGGFLTTLRLRQDIPALIRLINQLPEVGVETKLLELNFAGFVEFMVQYAH